MCLEALICLNSQAMKKATTKAGVIRAANRAAIALKDLFEDAHSVAETRDAARGYLQTSIIEAVNKIEAFKKQIEKP
jgi:hypothetical protein